MAPVAAGLIGGVAGALVLSRLVRSQLYAVSANSPGTYAGVVLLLAAISLAAIAVPALRATRIDPTKALRSE